MLPFTVPACINEISSSHRLGAWPIASCRVELGRHRIVSVRCSLSMPGRRASLAGAPGCPRGNLFGSSGFAKGLTTAWSAVLANHKAWSEKSMQTLQRVSTLIRSTSIDCLAALGTKKAASQPPNPDQPPELDPSESQLKASLSRFITTASKAEVAQAAMLADLSNMAYDVEAIQQQHLQQHQLMMIAHSRADAATDAATAEDQQLAEPRSLALPLGSQQQHASGSPFPVPHSPAAAGQSPTWDAVHYFGLYAASSSSISSGLGSAPTSPRTPFVLSSFNECDDTMVAADAQLATVSASVTSPGTPRRMSSALSAAATSSVSTSSRAAAPAGVDAPMQLSGSSSAGAALAVQLMQYQQQEVDQYQQPAALSEQQALLELQQQEQQVRLEMQQHQQLQLLLQQEQAIMQQLQEQASAGTASSSPASTSWWLQGLQQQWPGFAAPAPAAATSTTSSRVDANSPADWFVCDGPSTGSSTRYIVIQGSISLDHWRINLTIDPCEFENGALGGVKVHRGVYEAALEMYDTFVPLVKEHLAKHPDGKIAFTGHSLGGSLATLLMLLLVHRGVLPAANVATVRTFGAPAIFCEGATGSPPSGGFCQSCSLPCEHREERSAASAAAGAAASAAGGAAGGPGGSLMPGLTGPQDFQAGGLLGRLGLAPETVVNVIMGRDIVPRAFVCDYTLVADVLKNWLPSFKEHVGLAACKDHKALYNFIGTVEVLQPSLDSPFMLPDEAHTMLPEEPALYKLTEPCCTLPAEPAAAAPTPVAPAAAPAPATCCSGSSCNSCSGCSGCSSKVSSSSSAGKKQKSSKLGAFGSWGSLNSLASLGNLSLTSAIADLTSTFTLVSSGGSGSLVSVPVSAAEAESEAAAAAPSPADADEPAAAAAPELCDAAARPAALAPDPLGLTLGDAILTFMNTPHPLETLSEMRAYGPAGSISRFHNPQSYTTALQILSNASK